MAYVSFLTSIFQRLSSTPQDGQFEMQINPPPKEKKSVVTLFTRLHMFSTELAFRGEARETKLNKKESV